MKIKALIAIIVIGLVLAFAFHFNAIAYLDAPHNESYHVWCGRCHGEDGILESAYSGGSWTYDDLCTKTCHRDRVDCEYTDLDAPKAIAHSDSNDNKLADCCTCHDPHYQRQKNYNLSDPDDFYIAKGRITSFTYDSGSYESTLTYSSIEYKTETGWDATKLTGKTQECRRTILFPDKSKLGFSYPIIAITEDTPTEGTITVKGKVNEETVYMYKDPPTDFVILYGQYLRQQIKACSITTNQGCNKDEECPVGEECILIGDVKFFDKTGANSFADGDGIYNGICEVCHTQTDHYRNEVGGASDQHHSNVGGADGTNCIKCHSHRVGFVHGDGSGTECIDCHGTTGSHPAHNVETIGCNPCHDSEYNVVPGTGYFFTYDDDTNTCSDISCHYNTEATWDKSACTGCHSIELGNRVDVMAELTGNSHHIQGTTVEGKHCYQCHWEADVDGLVTSYHENKISGSPVDLVQYGAGTRPTEHIDGTTAIQYTANGLRAGFENLNDHCISCHSEQNNETMPFRNDTEPFGDEKTPKEYAWDNTSINARYSQTENTIWDKYANPSNPKRVTNKYQIKSYSAHGNAVDNEGGWNLGIGLYKRIDSAVWYVFDSWWDLTEVCWGEVIEEGGEDSWPNTRNGSENVLCFDCHNSHGSNVIGKTTSYDDNDSTTTNHGILKDTQDGKGGYAMTYKPEAGGSADDKNPYRAGAALCFDCHLTETAGDKPWGYNETFGASEPIMGDRDTPYFGLGISGAQQRYTYKQARTHQGGHFGTSLGGIATSGSTATIEDTAKNWSPDQLVDYYVIMKTGDNTGENRRITTNTKNTLTIETEFDNPVMEGDFYAIMYRVPDGKIDGLCTPCHDPHGVSTSLNQDYAVPLLKGTWMTSIYQDDRAPETSEMGPRRGGKFTGAPLGCCSAGNCPGWYLPDAAKEPGYRIDQNTLYPVNDILWWYANPERISETAEQFAGLCLMCHQKETLTDGVDGGQWKSMDRIHETVNGWGANTMHSFPCSKCHTPHSSRLPRLMITNCLDYNHNGRVHSGGKAEANEYAYNHGGSAGGQGAGRFPAGGGGRGYSDINPYNPWNGDGYPGYYRYGFGYGYTYHKCHQDTNPGDWPDRELWNIVTRWEEVGISSGPSAGSFTAVGQHELATITWETDALWTPGEFFSTSCVDYGLTENYGSTICRDELVTDHTMIINMFYNHMTYHYRVRSATPDGIEAVSEDNTFDISVPPTVPDLIDEPDNECAAPSCSIILEWNLSIDSDNDPIEYKVKVVKASDSEIYYESDWISGNCIDNICSWTVPVLLVPDINTNWWWVVWARNAEHTGAVSSWPLADFFRVVPVGDTSRPPSIPYPIDEPDNECGDVSCFVTLAWHPSTNPTGGPLEYKVQVDDDGWFLSPDYEIIWTPEETANIGPIPTNVNTTWYWRVKAKGVDTELESNYSARGSFKVVPLPPQASPPAPFLIAEPDFDSGNIDTDVTLQWESVTDPDGHTVQYLVEVDNNPNFSNPDYPSVWDSTESYDITVAPCTKWWWRVKARDAVDGQESQWSLTDNFMDTSNSCTTVVDESFEETKSVDDGYDDAPWTEIVDNISCPNCILDPDSAIPGTTPPPDAGSQCLKSVSAAPDYRAYTTIDYGLEQPKTFTSFYLYVEAEDLAENSGKFIAAFQDSAGNNVFSFRLYRLSGQLFFNLRIYNNGAMRDYGFNAVVSLNTWYRVNVKYDDTDNTWEWNFSKTDGTILDQNNGNLTGVHYTGIQKWNLGFWSSSQTITGTVYFDLLKVNTVSYY